MKHLSKSVFKRKSLLCVSVAGLTSSGGIITTVTAVTNGLLYTNNLSGDDTAASLKERNLEIKNTVESLMQEN